MLNKIVLSLVAIPLVATSLIAGIKKVEITPMVGKKIYNYSDDKPRFDDGKVVLGGRANVYVTDSTSIQLGIEGSKDNPIEIPGRTGASTDLLRGMVNVQKDIPNRSRVTPYVFAGLGGEKVYKTVKSTNLDSQMFYNGGVGLRYSVNDKVDLVSEARVIHKVEDKDTDLIGNVGVGFKFGMPQHRPVKTLQDLAAMTPAPAPTPMAPAKVEPEVLPAEPAPEVEPIIVGSLDEKEAAVSSEVVGEDTGCAPTSDVTETCPSDRDTVTQQGEVESGYYIQVISLARNSADKVTRRLDRMGLSYRLENNGTMTRVLVGPFASRGAARRSLRKAKRVSRDAFIVSR